jgi:DNA-binding NarL/FixJ family response regulator
MISVICIDHELWFYRLLEKIAADRRIRIIANAQTGEKGFELVRQHKSEHSLFVLINTDLPDMSSEMICHRIHRTWPKIRCIFLMNQVHWPMLSRLVNSPAQGFLTKDACYLTLEAIEAISAGKTYLQPDLALGLIRYRESPQKDALHQLSPREYEVLIMLSKHKTYEAIAQSLHLQVRTIYNLRTAAFKKCGFLSHEQMCEWMSQHLRKNS